MTGPESQAPTGAAAPEVVVHRIGPGAATEGARRLAADNQFAGALITLWHKVSEAGGSVGFVPPVSRSEVAPLAAAAVELLRSGTIKAVALTANGNLVGVGFLQPGRAAGVTAHTGDITRVMVDPDLQGSGLGSTVMTAVLELAAELGLERVSLSVREGEGLETFYGRFGFVEYGRRPGWLRLSEAEDRTEIMMWAPVP